MKKTILLLLLILFIFPGIIALFHSGFFLTDDGNSMVIRFSAFYEALRHGQFPVRFLPRLNFNYGYPVVDFLYPLFLYIGVPIHILGFNFVLTIKIILGLSLLVSAICSFLWLRKLFDDIASFAGAITYALFPYHLWDIYKRGSVGEVLGLAMVPFILWQIERKSVILVGVGIALLILAHNILALLFLPIIIIYIYLSKKISFRATIILLMLGLGLSAFFWIPAITDRQYTIFDKTIVSDFAKYFLSSQEYFLVGLISIIAIVFSLYALLKHKKIIYWFFWLLTVISIFFSLPISQIIWRYIPGTYLLQFPFRLLSLTTLGISVLVALTVSSAKKKYIWVIAGFFIFLVYFSSANLFIPKNFQEYPDTYYSTNVDSTTVQNEYMPVWVKTLPLNIPSQKVILPDNDGVINAFFSNGNIIQFNASIKKSTTIQVNTVYFPGWKVFVDGKEQKIFYNNSYGIMQIPIGTGFHTVIVKFTETNIRLICDIITVISIFAGIIIFIWERRYNALI